MPALLGFNQIVICLVYKCLYPVLARYFPGSSQCKMESGDALLAINQEILRHCAERLIGLRGEYDGTEIVRE